MGVTAVSRTEVSQARVGCAGHSLRSILTQFGKYGSPLTSSWAAPLFAYVRGFVVHAAHMVLVCICRQTVHFTLYPHPRTGSAR